MKEILESAITNNMIALLSLIVSIIGLIITGKTMQSAKKIEEEMEKMKIDALNRSSFLKLRPQLVKKIEGYIKSLKRAEVLSRNLYMDIFETILEIKETNNIFNKEDHAKIVQIHETINIVGTKLDSFKDSDIKCFIESLVQIKNILNKGDYTL